MSENGSVSVIIPAYNEAEGLRDALVPLKELSVRHNWQVIVVDDGSTDNTSEIARGVGFEVVTLPYNIGYGAALKAGIRASDSDILVFMDGDGQHDPRNIRRLVRRIEPYDMVVGARRKGGAESWIRKPGKWLLSRVADFLADMKIPDINSGFRAVRRTCAEEFTMIYPNGFSFSTTITLAMIRAGYSIKYVPIRIRPRLGRKSTVSQGRDGTKTILLILRCVVLFNPEKRRCWDIRRRRRKRPRTKLVGIQERWWRIEIRNKCRVARAVDKLYLPECRRRFYQYSEQQFSARRRRAKSE